MTKEMIRLAYISTLRPGVTSTDLDDLVAEAASFNKAHDITGVLALEGSQVCQILEGPVDVVEKLYASIQRDDRHHGVATIEHRPISKTAFENWGMVKRNMVDMVIYAMRA